MRIKLVIGLLLPALIAMTAAVTAGATARETTASRVFDIASSSVVVTEAFDTDGNELAQGSGVVIAKDVVVTNCHVFEEAGTDSAGVFYHNKHFPATLRYGDPKHDLCSLTVRDLAAPPIKMGSTAKLKVGEDVYAIGAPEGLNLTLSSGLLSGLRKVPGYGTVIQTTAPISPGSSGGGLFDSRGRLIGITSYYLSKGQQLNFALPAAWIKALPQRGKVFTRIEDLPHNGTLAETDKGKAGRQALRSGDYATALSIFQPLAKEGYIRAQNDLGLMYANGQGVPQDYSKALYWYRKAAAQGGVRAQTNLGGMYANGHGVPQDYSQALYWYRKAAAEGFPGAEYGLGMMQVNGNGVQRNVNKGITWIREAANQGYARAQAVIGLMYGAGYGPLPQDDVLAATWLSLASAGGDKKASKMLSMTLSRLSTPQLGEVVRLVRQWRSEHHKQ